MKTLKEILFFADGAEGEKYALTQCIELAAHHGASLTVVDVVAEVESNDVRLETTMKKLQNSLIDERKTALQSLLDLCDQQTLSSSIKILVLPGKDYIEIIRAVISTPFDLVIKSTNQHNVVSATLFGDTDLNLLRKCPCPIWIIKPQTEKKIYNVLAAIDLTESFETRQLACQVVELAANVAAQENAQLLVMNAWQPPSMPHFSSRLEGKAFDEMMQAIKDTSTEQLHTLAAHAAPATPAEYLVDGKAEDAIIGLVNSNEIDLLVMGTMSRGGIPGLLIGNTAEKVLYRANCSVLTLKPDGFKSPVL
ncbi:MAG: universal stress protein E [Candidatus Pseudothioglobus sp.]|jgi:universal stress protein E